MLARVAENIYWLGRYLERIDGTVRLINAHTNVLLDSPYTDARSGWLPLIAVMGIDELYFEHYQQVTAVNVSKFIITDKHNPGSLVGSTQSVRYNLRACRDMVPTSLYATINKLCLRVKNIESEKFNIADKRHVLADIGQDLLSIKGALDSTMNRDQSYQFMRIGFYIERADMTSRILDVRSANLLPLKDLPALVPFENRQWESVLQSVSALQMYRRTCGPVVGPAVLAYLLQNTDSPRSYHYCIDQLHARITALGGGEKALDEIDKLHGLLKSADVNELANDPASLHGFVDELEIHLAGVSDGIASSYYSPKDI